MPGKTSSLLLVFALSVVGAARALQETHSKNSALPAPPKTRVENVKEIIHETEITDPYRWLEKQDSPETRAWIDAQNAYTDSLLTNLPA